MLKERRRIGFFGGTFDPLHNGHLAMARAALDHLQLDRLCFVPARQNPLKAGQPLAGAADRLAMLHLGIEGEQRFVVWEGELGRSEPSYTLHSVQHLERVYPNSHLFWVIGSDHLPDLPRWHGIAELAGKIGFIVLLRPGHALHWPRVPGLALYPVANPPVTVSATEVRACIRAGLPFDHLVPSAVASYLRDRDLYR